MIEDSEDSKESEDSKDPKEYIPLNLRTLLNLRNPFHGV